MDTPTTQTGFQKKRPPRLEKTGLAAFYGGLAIGVVLLFLLVMSSVASFLTYQDDIHARMKSLLEPVAAYKDTDDVTMVLLGNSRMRHALTFGFDPAKLEHLPDGRPLRAVQFAQDVAMFEFYEPIWPDIIAAKPDILVIQKMLLTTARRRDTTILDGVSKTVFNGLRNNITGLNPLEDWEEERHHIIDEMCLGEDDFTRAAMQDRIIFGAYRDNHKLVGNDQTLRLRTAIREAIAAGIRVVMVDFPINEEQISKFDVPLHYMTNYGLGSTPTKSQLLPALQYRVGWMDAREMEPPHFCDFVHLNEKGRRIYTDWFLSNITGL